MSGGGSGAVSVDLWLPRFRSTGSSLGYRGSKNLLVFLHTAPLEHSIPLSQPRLELIPGCRIVDLGSRQIHHIFSGTRLFQYRKGETSYHNPELHAEKTCCGKLPGQALPSLSDKWRCNMALNRFFFSMLAGNASLIS